MKRKVLGKVKLHKNVQFYRRQPHKGPHVVVIGGGTGLSTMLRGLKRYTENISAIVTVADNGGSSGMLRKDLGMLPPGDIRNCILALADSENLMEPLMNYRFPDGNLAGHNFGNLFIAAMSGVSGSFYDGVRNFSNVLAVTGKVLPVSLNDINISAELSNGQTIIGESSIGEQDLPEGVRIERIRMIPENARPLTEAIEEILAADLVVLGPGSLYTSIIPNLLFSEIVNAVRETEATVCYVCNIMTQPAETRAYTCSDHVNALLEASGQDASFLDFVVANDELIEEEILGRYKEKNAEAVLCDRDQLTDHAYQLIVGNFMLIREKKVRHDSEALARILASLGADAVDRKIESATTRIFGEDDNFDL